MVPDWLEEKLQQWEDPIIKVTQKWFLNIVSLLLNRIIAGEQISHVYVACKATLRTVINTFLIEEL